jgi:DNA polymerase-1
MAHLSGDRGLIEAFAHGLDVHRATAAEVFGVEFARVPTTSAAARRRSTSA